MYCTYCGQQNRDVAQFCRKCGASLQAVSQVRGSIQETSGRERIKVVNRAILAALAAVAGGLVAIICGVLWYCETASVPSSPLEELLRKLQGLPPNTYHPHTTEAIILWVIGSILLIIGLVGSWYYAKKRSETLHDTEQ